MNTFRSSFSAISGVALAALVLCANGSAATATYTFDEAGWVNSEGVTQDFFGSFTGLTDPSGNVTISDLFGFSATITETNSSNETKTIATFGADGTLSELTSFLYTSASNTLDLEASGTPGALICLGTAVGTGDCGAAPARPQPKPGTPPLPPINGLFSFSVNGALNAYTANLPVITVTPLFTPVQAPATAPEPEPFFLCGGTLLLASLLLRLCRRRCPPAAARCC